MSSSLFLPCFSVHSIAFPLQFLFTSYRIYQLIYGVLARPSWVDTFQQFVCCPACHSIYPWEDCINKLSDGLVESKVCSFQAFPHHPQRARQRQCGESLMKMIKSSNGKVSLYPKLIYCYKSVIESLRDLVAKTRFIEKCELWRDENTLNDVYSDVYDGQVWKDFLCFNGVPFYLLLSTMYFNSIWIGSNHFSAHNTLRV